MEGEDVRHRDLPSNGAETNAASICRVHRKIVADLRRRSPLRIQVVNFERKLEHFPFPNTLRRGASQASGVWGKQTEERALRDCNKLGCFNSPKGSYKNFSHHENLDASLFQPSFLSFPFIPSELLNGTG
jgi:hypothetical protein